SCFTYERRGPEGQQALPPPRWPTPKVAERARAIDQIAAQLNRNEGDAGLPETRAPDPGFTPYVHDWAQGDALADVLDDDGMAGDDAALAAVVATHPSARVAFRATETSDFARAVGLARAGSETVELPCDALDVETDGAAHTAVNMVVIGTAPDRQRWWTRSRA